VTDRHAEVERVLRSGPQSLFGLSEAEHRAVVAHVLECASCAREAEVCTTLIEHWAGELAAVAGGEHETRAVRSPATLRRYAAVLIAVLAVGVAAAFAVLHLLREAQPTSDPRRPGSATSVVQVYSVVNGHVESGQEILVLTGAQLTTPTEFTLTRAADSAEMGPVTRLLRSKTVLVLALPDSVKTDTADAYTLRLLYEEGSVEVPVRLARGTAAYASVGLRAMTPEMIVDLCDADSPAATGHLDHSHGTSIPWSSLATVPAGIADGDADTTYSAGSGLTLTGTTFSRNSVTFSELTDVPSGLGDDDSSTSYACRSLMRDSTELAWSSIASSDLSGVPTGLANMKSGESMTRTVTVTPVNDAPVVTATAESLVYVEHQAATAVDPGLTTNDVDSANLVGATVAITGSFASGQDVLLFTNQGGIAGSYNAGTGVMTLTGTATVAAYQAALRTVSYVNSSEDPSALTRTVTFTANDGGVANNLGSASRMVKVTRVNQPPPVTATAAGLAYVEDQAATAIDPGLTTNDVDSTILVGATVAITANFAAGEDVLSFDNQGGIAGSYNAGTGVLTLSGSAPIAAYQAALRAVTYANSSEAPTASTRTVTFSLNDNSNGCGGCFQSSASGGYGIYGDSSSGVGAYGFSNGCCGIGVYRPLEPGDVLVISKRRDGMVALCTEAESTAVAGVYSTKPGALATMQDGAAAELPQKEIPCGLVGRMLVKTCDEGGPIHRGDLLVSASRPGYAKKAPPSPKPGTIVGKAFADLETGAKKILVLVSLQ
jgi:hypothetical protein